MSDEIGFKSKICPLIKTTCILEKCLAFKRVEFDYENWSKLPIEKLNICTKSLNCLRALGAFTLGMVEEKIFYGCWAKEGYRNIGRKTYDEISWAIKEHKEIYAKKSPVLGSCSLLHIEFEKKEELVTDQPVS